MKREQAISLLPLIKAWSEGATIQIRYNNADKEEWRDRPDDIDWHSHPSMYRIKPEPKVRPWTLQEIPVGAVARRKDRDLKVKSFNTPSAIAQVIYTADFSNGAKKIPGAVMKDGWFGVGDMLELWEWRWPGETVWKLCGVIEG